MTKIWSAVGRFYSDGARALLAANGTLPGVHAGGPAPSDMASQA